MTKQGFVQIAKPVVVDIAGNKLVASPMEYKTGSVGYNITGKVHITLDDGTILKCQVSGNCVVVGSKEWADKPAADAAA